MSSSTLVKRSTLAAGIVGLIGLSSFCGAANAASIVNGGFETADFTGWTVINQPSSNGSWFNTGGGTAPLSGLSIPSASEGTRYAVSSQTGPTSQALFQDITLEAGFQHTLSFDWLAQSWPQTFADAGTMSKDVFPNQHFRVDLVSTDFTDWFGPSSSAGILANILAPVAENAPVTGWHNLTSFDLTPWAGSTVRLAFRQVDNQGYFNAGVDKLKISSTPIETVPEPTSTVSLLALGALGATSHLKRKQQQK